MTKLTEAVKEDQKRREREHKEKEATKQQEAREWLAAQRERIRGVVSNRLHLDSDDVNIKHVEGNSLSSRVTWEFESEGYRFRVEARSQRETATEVVIYQLLGGEDNRSRKYIRRPADVDLTAK